MTVNEAARIAEVPRARVWAWCREKKLRHYRFGRSIRIRREDLDAFLAGKCVEVADESTEKPATAAKGARRRTPNVLGMTLKERLEYYKPR